MRQMPFRLGKFPKIWEMKNSKYLLGENSSVKLFFKANSFSFFFFFFCLNMNNKKQIQKPNIYRQELLPYRMFSQKKKVNAFIST